jgi:hypothetical protein
MSSVDLKTAIIQCCRRESLFRMARGHARHADGTENLRGLTDYLEIVPATELLTFLDGDELRAVSRALGLSTSGTRSHLLNTLHHRERERMGGDGLEASAAPSHASEGVASDDAPDAPRPLGLWPRTKPRSDNRGEGEVWTALREQLPEGWTAWHSLRVRVPQGQDGEVDFAVAIPGRGLLLLECKGGRLDKHDGRWRQNGRELQKSPREQAIEFRGKLLGVWRSRFPSRKPPFIAAAAVFPETLWDEGHGPGAADEREAILGGRDLPRIGERLERIAQALFRPSPTDETHQWVCSLHELWGEAWVPTVSLGALTEWSEGRRVQLDAEQLAAIRSVERNDRTFVLGGAGTGKTLIACEVAKRWAARGLRPVYLCFTEALASEVRAVEEANRPPGSRPRWEAWTVRKLAAEALDRANVAPGGGKPVEQWTSEQWDLVPPLAAGLVSHIPLPYDCVVVDEAQDLASQDWAFVRALTSGGRPLWVLGDPQQNFWRDERSIPRDMTTFTYELTSKHRCPPELAAFADGYRDDRHPDDDLATDAPLGSPEAESNALRVVCAQPGESVVQACERALSTLLDDGVRPEQIAVLSMAGLTKMTLGPVRSLAGWEVVRADAPGARDRLVVDTFLRFKGLERPWVILTDVGQGHGHPAVRMHIALTRATVGCVVVATEEALRADSRLARRAGLR